MTKFLAGILTVIAAGVLLIAYALLNPPAAAFDARTAGYGAAQPMYAGEQIVLRENPYATSVDYYGRPAVSYPAPASFGYAPYAPYSASQMVQGVPPARSASFSTAAQRPVVRHVVEKKPRRSWQKTAVLIGGSSAAGAGLGALLGGKKGALIGAAIGGGAGTIYETTKR